ncbi:MAG TPA: SDR family NAD(P)-dependent oxidoreductase [Dehalococcoidia bacterium]|nr:SDR family NAD(P)-dependent oxidoreductase [Dehalococcoidia bacterium]
MTERSQLLAGQVAVVTGASRGIGRAIAVEFARAGADIVVAARSSEKAPSKLPGTIEETARQVEAAGRRPNGRPSGRALAVPMDVTDEAQVQAMAQRTLDEFGRADILVNNAGITFPAPFSQTPLKRWDLVMNVNLRGPIMCTQAFLPHMLERGSGRIINISSYLAEVLMPGMMSYSVSKIALEKFTQALAAELEPKSIPVNALRIEMWIATEGAQYSNPNIDYSTWEKPEAASEATLWLATRDPSYTGQVVTIAEVRQQMAAG